jgi:hypothetical protein
MTTDKTCVSLMKSTGLVYAGSGNALHRQQQGCHKVNLTRSPLNDVFNPRALMTSAHGVLQLPSFPTKGVGCFSPPKHDAYIVNVAYSSMLVK